MTVRGVSKVERFFRAAASLDVDRNDLKRYGDFVDARGLSVALAETFKIMYHLARKITPLGFT